MNVHVPRYASSERCPDKLFEERSSLAGLTNVIIDMVAVVVLRGDG